MDLLIKAEEGVEAPCDHVLLTQIWFEPLAAGCTWVKGRWVCGGSLSLCAVGFVSLLTAILILGGGMDLNLGFL